MLLKFQMNVYLFQNGCVLQISQQLTNKKKEHNSKSIDIIQI